MKKRIRLEMADVIDLAPLYGASWDTVKVERKRCHFTPANEGRPYHGMRHDGGYRKIRITTWDDSAYGYTSLV